MAAHTPGPWSRDGLTIYALDETGNCNRFSTRIEGGWSFRSAGSLGASGDRTTEAELLANATLFEAAPDMLALLKAITTPNGFINLGDDTHRAALAAIAKAEQA